MVKVQEHIDKIKSTEQQIEHSNGKQKLQYIKHLHKLQKQLAECYMHTHPNENIDHIEIYYR